MKPDLNKSENSKEAARTMKVDILGTPYEIIVDTSGYLQDNNADGVDKNYSKTILVRDLDDYLDSEATIEEKEARRKETLRHEIVHAFFSESGLKGYYNDELLVEWLSIQFPKLLDAIMVTGAIEPPMGLVRQAVKYVEETSPLQSQGGRTKCMTSRS